MRKNASMIIFRVMKKQNNIVKQLISHEYDYDLVKRFLDYISNTALPKEKIREYKQLVKDYTIAVKLNKGPDIDRSIYWSKKVRNIHRTMRKVLD